MSVSKNINKKEFARLIAADSGLSLLQAELGLEGILAFFEKAFATDCIIEIRGFGKFVCKNGRARFKAFEKFF